MKLSKRKRNAKRNTVLWIVGLIIVIGLYNVMGKKADRPVKLVDKQETQVNSKSEQGSQPVESAVTGTSGDDWGIPAKINGRKEIIIHHKGYIVSYNPDWKTPNWSAWELTALETQGDAKRTNDFEPDPDITVPQADTDDYKRSGYSRGHMAPAADFRWNDEAMRESFYLSNICPQDQEMNSGDWSELEKQCRFWAKKDKSIWIVCGPIMSKNPKRIGSHQVAVPEGFFKVILAYSVKEPRMLGFIYQNKNLNIPMENYIKTVDEVEKETGIDFFPALPDNIENKLESEISTDRWRWPLGKKRAKYFNQPSMK